MGIQETIYKLETGSAAQWLRGLAICICLLGLAFWFVLTQFTGFDTPEAMDYAQLSRSLAKGEGFRTQFIRPLALGNERDFRFLKSGNSPTLSSLIPPEKVDLLKFPDTFSAPLFPFLESLAFRVSHAHFDLNLDELKKLRVYQPEYIVVVLNLVFFLLSAILVYGLAGRLFDQRVAGLAAGFFILSEIHWQFAISGLSTSWTTLLLLGAIFSFHEALLADEEDNASRRWIWLIGSSLLLGLCTITRYSLLWLIIPYLITILVAFPKRPFLVFICLLLIVIPFVPWGLRNLSLTGSPVGDSGFLIGSGIGPYPGDSLFRSYRFNSEAQIWKEALRKLLRGLHYLFSDGYRELGSNLAVTFFIVSFLHLFRRPRANFIRFFILLSLLVLTLGSSLVNPSPGPVSESNQIILLSPVMTIFGAAFIYILIDRLEISQPILRSCLLTLLVCLQGVPLFLTLILHEKLNFSYPPYFPPIIRAVGSWTEPQEVSMSDIPWASAWYGDRTTLWIPVSLKEFYEINDYVSPTPIATILFTPESGDKKLSDEINNGEWKDWSALIRRESLPKGFPLTTVLPMQPNQNDYLLISDRVRWH